MVLGRTIVHGTRLPHCWLGLVRYVLDGFEYVFHLLKLVVEPCQCIESMFCPLTSSQKMDQKPLSTRGLPP